MQNQCGCNTDVKSICACDWVEVRAIDVSDPENSTEIGYYEGISGSANGITAAENWVLLAGRDFFSIYQYSPEDGENVDRNGSQLPELFTMQNFPNPFNTTTTIS